MIPFCVVITKYLNRKKIGVYRRQQQQENKPKENSLSNNPRDLTSSRERALIHPFKRAVPMTSSLPTGSHF
jgi:hypothetical protein